MSVSRAKREIIGKSWYWSQVTTKANKLMIGSESNTAPIRG
ncbi:hypothetical protein NA78x_002756 [Anatilimnocola sp. NA78]